MNLKQAIRDILAEKFPFLSADLVDNVVSHIVGNLGREYPEINGEDIPDFLISNPLQAKLWTGRAAVELNIN